jgi:pyochelin biosynthetic protein PchC
MKGCCVMSELVDPDQWIRRLVSALSVHQLLLRLPYAGGSATYFWPFAQALAPQVEVLAAQYPGRQERHHEPFIKTMDELADRVTDAVAPVIDRPLAIFGHSMGAALGYEVARRLAASGLDPPLLLVSGRRAPTAVRCERPHEAGERELLEEVSKLGGTSPTLLRTPIAALTGDSDLKADLDEVLQWSEHTEGPFDMKVMPEGHFFLNDNLDTVVDHIRTLLLGNSVDC